MHGFYTREVFMFNHFQFCGGRKGCINKSRVLHKCVCAGFMISNSNPKLLPLTNQSYQECQVGLTLAFNSFEILMFELIFLLQLKRGRMSLSNSQQSIPVIKDHFSWCVQLGFPEAEMKRFYDFERASQGSVKDSPTFKIFSITAIHYTQCIILTQVGR